MAKLSLFEKRRQRVRSKLRAQVAGRPRLSVHRTGRHIYAQVIDDSKGVTLASASTNDKAVKTKNGSTSAAAAEVGKRVAEAAKKSRCHQRRVRPWWFPVPWSRQGAGRCCP